MTENVENNAIWSYNGPGGGRGVPLLWCYKKSRGKLFLLTIEMGANPLLLTFDL
jgi:hypothetical protein